MTEKHQGAEATVTIGEKARKERGEKKYRHPGLDRKIREERNRKEIRMLEEARQNGVNVPKVKEKSRTGFTMEKIEGKILKQVIENEPGLTEKLAEQAARLHSADIIHGDLTTSNAVFAENQVYLIDFGLAFRSERIEDKAVDIHLLKQVFKASHKLELWEKFAEKYREEEDSKIVEKVPEIEKRARYR
ncbi:MAG: KEOPS complex kinase/ATPase Bud32 [Candidatus Nanohalobium sp.]